MISAMVAMSVAALVAWIVVVRLQVRDADRRQEQVMARVARYAREESDRRARARGEAPDYSAWAAR